MNLPRTKATDTQREQTKAAKAATQLGGKNADGKPVRVSGEVVSVNTEACSPKRDVKERNARSFVGQVATAADLRAKVVELLRLWADEGDLESYIAALELEEQAKQLESEQ